MPEAGLECGNKKKPATLCRLFRVFSVSLPASVYVVVRTNVHQYNDLIAARWVRLKRENDPAVVLDPAGPQALQLPVKLVCLQLRLKRIFGRHLQHVQNALLQKRLTAGGSLERASKAGIPNQVSHASLSKSRRKSSTVP
jgi:hypothetical protein